MPITMTKIDTAKKPVVEDWHPAYIVYRLRLRGLSLRKLSREHGYCAQAAQLACRLPWPKMQKLIAAAIGVPPAEIWPTRYESDGSPKNRRKRSSSPTEGNVRAGGGE